MNTKTVALALGVAGVLLVAGLATIFSSTQLSDLLDNNKGASEGSNNNAIDNDLDTDRPGPIDESDNDENPPILPTGPVPTSPTPIPAKTVQGEPNLWMEYTTSWSGDVIRYGMPDPYSNRFVIETNEYGPDQPDGEFKITHFIHITDVAPRSGNIGDPEGTVEIRTYNPESSVSRLVNLYDDGKGGCYGILVDTFATWDYTWMYEHDKIVKFTQTFSINITKLGSHTIDVYAIHDHGDGSYKVVSNHLTRTFTTQARDVIKPSIMYSPYQYTNAIPMDLRASVERGTYRSNIHGMLPYVYSNDVKVKLFVEGTGFSLRMGGIPMTGVTTTYENYGTTYIGTMFELGTWSADSLSGEEYSLSITFTDGKSHNVFVIVSDIPSGELVGLSSAWFSKST